MRARSIIFGLVAIASQVNGGAGPLASRGELLQSRFTARGWSVTFTSPVFQRHGKGFAVRLSEGRGRVRMPASRIASSSSVVVDVIPIAERREHVRSAIYWRGHACEGEHRIYLFPAARRASHSGSALQPAHASYAEPALCYTNADAAGSDARAFASRNGRGKSAEPFTFLHRNAAGATIPLTRARLIIVANTEAVHTTGPAIVRLDLVNRTGGQSLRAPAAHTRPHHRATAACPFA